MNKRKLHHVWTRLRPISAYYFLILFILFSVVSVYALRSNNLEMIRRREAVVRADQENGDTETALRHLREYVHAHMNTNLASGPGAIKPPIQLRHRYERLVQAEKERVAAVNSRIISEAQTECERRFPTGPIVNRVPCTQEFISNAGIKEQPIPDGLYKFDFVSPTWSPDLAGWSLVASAVFGGLFLMRWGLERLIKREL